jgi:hypothetical protein
LSLFGRYNCVKIIKCLMIIFFTLTGYLPIRAATFRLIAEIYAWLKDTMRDTLFNCIDMCIVRGYDEGFFFQYR